ncbi:MAG TPA: YgiQ family radical SAM protein, partial [Candidatus Sabulitectum sp.]|nr:YgiQ family radical SAM protein [Candidatus Sabulitectum sp.]
MKKPLPMSRREMDLLGWSELDVLLVTGDAYVDHPSFGAAVIGRVLLAAGYRVGIIAQPDCSRPETLEAMGRPLLFAGVTSGNMDSMVNHYTSLGRIRTNDAYTEGGAAGRRPDRALLKYTNIVQRVFKGLPVVIGGIEASLRRVSHYDFWSSRLKKSILLDSKAAILVYGMGERQIVEIAGRLSRGEDLSGIRGTAVAMHRNSYEETPGDIWLPSHEELLENPPSLIGLTAQVEENQNPWLGRRLVQAADSRMVVVEPPCYPMSQEELDSVYDLPYTR